MTLMERTKEKVMVPILRLDKLELAQVQNEK